MLRELPERPTVSTVISNTRTTLEMIKIEHTLFALPFAFLGSVLGANGLPSFRQILWIIVAMVGARSTAMAFNRLADRKIDARNPRTAMRALPAGQLSVGFVWAFTVASAAVFLIAAAMLNRLTLILAPVALGSVFLYSLTKRWTQLSHIVLGWCLSIAPTGAWIAVRGEIADERNELVGPEVLRLVGPLDAEGLEPIAVDHRRARMRDGVAHDASFLHQSGENEVDLRMRHSWL